MKTVTPLIEAGALHWQVQQGARAGPLALTITEDAGS